MKYPQEYLDSVVIQACMVMTVFAVIFGIVYLFLCVLLDSIIEQSWIYFILLEWVILWFLSCLFYICFFLQMLFVFVVLLLCLVLLYWIHFWKEDKTYEVGFFELEKSFIQTYIPETDRVSHLYRCGNTSKTTWPLIY